jgi:HEAT repeat protein
LGYSSREELPQLIEKAYDSGNKDWLISALFAMGRSANDRWEAMVLEHLQSQVEEVRFEAARAAGELELRAARPILFEMLDEDNADIRMTAAWSLSQIGGEGVQEALESLLEETEETEEAEFLEDALENLEFTEDTSLLDLMEVDEEPDFDDEQDEYAYDDEEETDKD